MKLKQRLILEKNQQRGFSIYLIFVILSIIFLYALPHIFGLIHFSNNYNPINIHNNYDSTSYTAKVKEAYEGNPFVQESLVYEQKNSNRLIMRVFNPIIYSIVAHLFWFLEFKWSYILTLVIFTGVNAYILYLIFNKIFKNKYYSVLSSVLIVTSMLSREGVLLFFHILNNIFPKVSNFLLGFIGRDESNLVMKYPLLFYNYNFRPNLTFIFLGLSIILYLNMFEKKKISLPWIMLSGFVWATLFYSYFFYFVPFYFIVGFTIICTLLRKEFKIARKLIFTSGFAALFSLPYWISYFSLSKMPQYLDWIARRSIEKGHYIKIIPREYILTAFMLILLFIFRKNIKTGWYYFLTAGLLSEFVVTNLQLITGVNPQPDHYYKTFIFMFIIPFTIITLMNLSFKKIKIFHRNEKMLNKIFISLTAVIIVSGFIWQINYYHYKKPHFTIENDEVSLYDHINQNFDPNFVIMSDDLKLNYHLPIYTHANLYMPYGFNTLISNKEILSRVIHTYGALNYSESEFIELFSKDYPYDVHGSNNIVKDFNFYLFHHGFYDENLYNLTSFVIIGHGMVHHPYLSNEQFSSYVVEYRDFLIDGKKFKPYKLDYIVTRRDVRSIPFADRGILLEKKIGKYNVYKVTNMTSAQKFKSD